MKTVDLRKQHGALYHCGGKGPELVEMPGLQFLTVDGRPDDWSWRAKILQPDLVDATALEEAVAQLRNKRPSAAVEELRLRRFEEGLCVQSLHVGPYATEPATVERMRAFAADHGTSW